MNHQFYYKGKTVSVNADESATIKKIYDLSVPKFNHYLAQELLLFGYHVRLRLKRNNGLLNWNDIANTVLLENDTLIIEPKDNVFTNSNQNCHTPKRYDISNIDKNYSELFLKSPVSAKTQSNWKFKTNDPNQSDLTFNNKSHRYQKSDQLQSQQKDGQLVHNNFDRNGTRRSLGAAFAPQFQILSSRENNSGFGSNSNNLYQKEDHSSCSSVSDIYSKNQKFKKTLKIGGSSNKSQDKKVFSKSAPASPTKPAPPVRSPQTHLTMMNTHNVRTLGQRMNITILKKPIVGLGFTLVTRDNQVMYGSGQDPSNSALVWVNKILKNGGAADDGRLIRGDRILEINSVPVTSLKDTIEKLRAIPDNASVDLLISRIENDTPTLNSPLSNLPKGMPQLTFEIPIDSRLKENQQLGLNIHYRNDKDNPSLGNGIYIHSILNNGLAAQHGGLQVNDKLVGINGQLLNDANEETTINILKMVMQNNPILSITVLREKCENQLSNQNENLLSQLSSNSNNNESISKPDPTHYILPNKLIMENKSRRVKSRQEVSSSYNNNRYSSSETDSQNDAEFYHSQVLNAFEREGKGRRSMSEKGKIHEDATRYKFYKDSRDGAVRSTERPYSADRAYSTLPTSTKMKSRRDSSPPPLPNKTPTKPSQIKIRNAQDSGIKSSNGTPRRSASLRDPSASHKSRSPRIYSQTPTYELPAFNRAMNNSFKKAVQNSNEQKNNTPVNYSLSHNSGKQYTNRTPTTQSEKDFQNYSHHISFKHQSSKSNSKNNNNNNILRTTSVKNTEKKKFNIKDYLSFSKLQNQYPRFSSNTNQTVKYTISGKSDTFPPDHHVDPQLPNYHSVNTTDSKQRSYSPLELPPEYLYCNDQAIIDSAKRVIEWQKKNADVISKENKYKENKIYQQIGSQIPTDSRIQKVKNDMNLRNSGTNKNANQIHYETDPYDTIESSGGQLKPKSSRGQSRSANNTVYGVTPVLPSSKTVAPSPRSNAVLTYQSNNNKKPSMTSTEIYATVSKSVTKKEHSLKSSNISQLHKNKYKF